VDWDGLAPIIDRDGATSRHHAPRTDVRRPLCARTFKNGNAMQAPAGSFDPSGLRRDKNSVTASAGGDQNGRSAMAIMSLTRAAAVGIWLIGAGAMAADGLATVQSSFGATETVDRLVAEIQKRGLTLFARVDHAAGAAEVGLPLRPTLLLIFGNATGGTPLMRADQTAGIDLPLKVLVWEDADGKTWLSYDEPRWIAARHGLATSQAHVVDALSAAVTTITQKAAHGP
jgi:uncharacterized protein (DUF302 family)